MWPLGDDPYSGRWLHPHVYTGSTDWIISLKKKKEEEEIKLRKGVLVLGKSSKGNWRGQMEAGMKVHCITKLKFQI